ncbi:DNA-binding domain-containing protein, AraC-type [Actinoalloteichus hymeniacidonis]|uniref:DNA-binding domain-containing protein, AraC-type n=1 Tax=Actinoalloteichus hymeniacidonis TaxID=340345 RepID=A0AAC9MZX1_9PSEU|nr:DNA-binding domain-containing protein, AraC-type [Actinoalloteichus hymeniacidonis]
MLYEAAARQHFQLGKHAPAPEIAPFVEYYWTIHWNLPGDRSHRQWVIPHPTVHLVFDPAGSTVNGVMRGRFSRLLSGSGRVLGIRFRPGGFRPFLDGPVSQLTDRVIPLAEFLDTEAEEQARRALDIVEPAAMVASADEFLRPRLPAVDPMVAVVADLVRQIVDEPDLARVDTLADRVGMGRRTLQRLFAEYVGVSPKWVLLRARVHEAALRADEDAVDWASLAADLGYSDQAHLTRDFARVVGVSPARYARGCRRDASAERLRKPGTAIRE